MQRVYRNGQKGQAMDETSTATQTPAHEQDTLDQYQLWIDAVQTVTAKAYERMPNLNASIEKAYNLVIEGHVLPLKGNTFQVATMFKNGRQHWIVDKTCNCPDHATAVEGLCAHRLATMIYTRAKQLLGQHQGTKEGKEAPAPVPETQAPAPTDATPVAIPEKYIVEIRGTRAVKFIGLLYLAHDRGLVSLHAQWSYNDEGLSLAEATAQFNDGRTFTECGDATPDNVGAMVKAHWRRMALTRAKSRALRDALGVELVAAEELAG